MTNFAMDHIKAAIAELTFSQLKFIVAVDTMATKLDDLLQRLALRKATQHFPSSSTEQSPSLPFLSMPTLPPCSVPMKPSPAPLSTLFPMPTAPPCLAPMQPFPAPLPASLPMPASHLPNLSHIHPAISFENLFSIVLFYGHAEAPHDKPWENRDMVLFEMGLESYGTTMVARKFQPTAFALWTTAKPGAFCLDKPWDPGITFGSHGLKPQHLEDKVFLMG